MRANGAIRILAAATAALSTMLWAAAAPAEDAPEKPTRPALGKVVVFPFEAVNVDPGTTRAFTEIFQSALRARGATVLDWRPAHEELLGETAAEEPASPPPPPAQPAPPPPPVPMVMQPQPQAGMPSPVVNHTTPPPPPGTAAPAPQPQPQLQPYYNAPQVIYVQPQPPAPAPYVQPAPPPEPAMPASVMQEIARRTGAEQYIVGSLTRLGSQIRVTVLLKDIGGQEIANQVMDARTEQDLSNVLERIAQAMVERRSTTETLDLDNATMDETQKLPERFKLETNLGAVLGEGFSLSPDMNHFTLLGFDARFEIQDLLVELTAGFAFAAGKSDRDSEPGLLAGITVAYYLSHTSVAPYLGAGAGIYLGRLLGEPEEDPEPGDYESDDDEDIKMGFHASPMVGVEFLRRTRIRVHVDLRWMLAFDPEGRFGHGPLPTIGINF